MLKYILGFKLDYITVNLHKINNYCCESYTHANHVINKFMVLNLSSHGRGGIRLTFSN